MRCLAFLAFAVLVGCGSRNPNQCGSSIDCDLGGGGSCIATASGNQWCAYPDPECPGGYRYSTQDIGDGVSGQCVTEGDDGNMRTLTVTMEGSGAGTVASTPAGLTCEASTCSGRFAVGARIELAASATSAAFLGWSAPCSTNTDCSITLDEDTSLSVVFGTPGQALWAQQLSGTGMDAGYGIAATADGALFAVGTFSGSMTLGGATLVSTGGTDVYVARLDAQTGNVIWAKSFGSASNENAYAVAVDDDDNVYVAGSFAGPIDFGGGSIPNQGDKDAFLLKVDANGAFGWAKAFGGTGADIAYGVAVRNGAIAVVGSFRASMSVVATVLTSAGLDDLFIARFKTDGTLDWAHSIGGASADIARSVAIDSADSVVVTGYFYDHVDFGGGSLQSAGGPDVFLAKYSGVAGAYQFARRFGGASTEIANSVAVDAANNIVIIGGFFETGDFGGGSPLVASNGEDIFVAKYSQAGAYQWANAYGGTGSESGLALSVNGTGDVALTGNFCGTISFGGSALSSASACANFDVFAARLSPAGNHLNSVRAGGAGSEAGAGVAQTADGRFYVTGDFSGFAEFGEQAFTAAGQSDAFVLGLAPL